MPRATWNGAVLAQSDDTVVVEGNYYFPPADLNWEFLQPNDHHTNCWWKGVASYYDVVVGDQTNHSAAWTYPEPSPKAAEIKDYVAFWHGVRVER